MKRIVLITGSASGIGKAAARLFTQMGDTVAGIDIKEGEYFQGDISDPAVLEAYADKVVKDFGRVDVLIHNALPVKKGLHDCSWDEFMYALKTGAAAPFYLTKLLEPYFTENSSIINVSSTRDAQSQKDSESYAAAKGAIHSLTHAMAMSLAPKTRVNSISPGWINTSSQEVSPEDALQHPAGRVGKPSDAAWLMAFLASDAAGFIDGENITLDGGMSKRMIYHGDENWTWSPDSRNVQSDSSVDLPSADSQSEAVTLEETVQTEDSPSSAEPAAFTAETEDIITLGTTGDDDPDFAR